MSNRLSPEAARLVRAGRTGLGPTRRDVDRLRARILVGAAAGAAGALAGTGTAGASISGTASGAAAAGTAATGVGTAATGTAAAATGTAAAATGAAAGGLGVLKVVAIVAAVTGASVTGGVLVTRSSDPSLLAPSSVRALEDATVHHPVRNSDSAPDPVPDPVPVPVPAPTVDRDFEPVPPAATHRKSTRARPPSLSDELSILRRARAAMRAGDPRTALAELDRHARQVPTPRLAPEAASIRIEATCAAGQRDLAARLGQEFLTRWPDSPLARRIPKLCGGPP